MIDFITSYDDSTRCNRDLYDCFDHQGRVHYFLDNDAVRRNAIRYNGSSVWFFMSHGDDDKIIGNDGLAALDLQNLIHLGASHIFAYCCNSGVDIGPAFAGNGGVYFGFCDPIDAPPPNPVCYPAASRLFNFIRQNFQQVNGRIAAEAFIRNLLQEILICERHYDDLNLFDELAYYFLRTLKTKISIYLPNEPNSPVISPENVPRSIFAGNRIV